jgi:elongator complex protein 5
MAEAVVRSLRDGCLEGEHAPALSLHHSLPSPSPLASLAFRHLLTSFLSLVAAAKSQARGILLVAFDRSPSFYLDLFERHAASEFDAPALALHKDRIRILDCYSDPLGWNLPLSHSHRQTSLVTLLKNVQDLDHLLCSILHLATGMFLNYYDKPKMYKII